MERTIVALLLSLLMQSCDSQTKEIDEIPKTKAFEDIRFRGFKFN